MMQLSLFRPRCCAVWAVAAALAVAPLPADDPPPEKQQEAKPRKVNVVVKSTKEARKLPERVALPAPGEHAVEDILALATSLTGRTVRIESEAVRETKVAITAKLAASHVTLDELKVLLAAHRVYLFEVSDPVEGEILVASRDPKWQEGPPRRTRVVEVSGQSFAAAWARVKAAVEEKNRTAGEGTVVAIPNERTGKIILGGASDEALEELARLVAPAEKKDPGRPRLYTHVGEHRPAAELQKEVLDRLGEGERGRVTIVVSAKGNRLFFRAPEATWTKIQGLLKELDRKKQ